MLLLLPEDFFSPPCAERLLLAPPEDALARPEEDLLPEEDFEPEELEAEGLAEEDPDDLDEVERVAMEMLLCDPATGGGLV